MTLAAQLREGVTGPAQTVHRALGLAAERSELGAFWSLATERAAEHVDVVEHLLRQRQRSELALGGVPLAVKDNFDISGVPTTGGLRDVGAAARADAVAVARLEAAGAISIGKTAMDPLAWSTHGQAAGYPPCRNPHDPHLSPGGSSSGSAVAVAAEIVPLAIGTDTAGSVRIPAAYCGVVGLKPPPARRLLDGCLPLAPSFDCVGVLAATVRSCAAAYQVLSGEPLANGRRGRVRVGILTDLFEASEPEVSAVGHALLEAVPAAEMSFVPVRLDWRAPGFGRLLAAEFEREWGRPILGSPERFPSEIVDTIERARSLTETQLQQTWSELERDRLVLEARVSDFSALVCPTVPTTVPRVDAERVETSTRFTRIFSALRWSALSIPCGSDGPARLVGLQIVSAQSLAAAVSVAERLEHHARGV